MTQFDECLAFTLREEGGYSNDPADPGGATNFGITIHTLSHWRGVTCTPADVEALTVAEASAIYRASYWQTMQCGSLPAGVDLMTFDFGVNAGPGRAAVMLQSAVGAAQDGAIGPLTVLAAKGVSDRAGIVHALATAQDIYYRGLADFGMYGNGWLARTYRRRDLALSMVAGVTVAAPASVTPAAPAPPVGIIERAENWLGIKL
ncbi:MAG: glycoside hydrolase family 108 protein [Bradyrhizobium sp.]|nr:glycoside hydrolase family 108 protein [Bradyrhizobium sp.]